MYAAVDFEVRKWALYMASTKRITEYDLPKLDQKEPNSDEEGFQLPAELIDTKIPYITIQPNLVFRSQSEHAFYYGRKPGNCVRTLYYETCALIAHGVFDKYENVKTAVIRAEKTFTSITIGDIDTGVYDHVGTCKMNRLLPAYQEFAVFNIKDVAVKCPVLVWTGSDIAEITRLKTLVPSTANVTHYEGRTAFEGAIKQCERIVTYLRNDAKAMV